MWIDTKYNIESEDALNYFEDFRLFSEVEAREGRAVVIERELGRRRALFNGREGIPDFYTRMSFIGSPGDISGKGMVSIEIAITDAGLILELEHGELLDRLKNYLSVNIGLQEAIA